MADALPNTPPDRPSFDEMDVAGVRPELTFWQRDWVQNLLPMFTSLAVHLIVLGLGLVFLATAARVAISPPPAEELLVADATFVDDSGDVGGLVNPGLTDNPDQSAAQMIDEAAVDDGFAEQKSSELSENLLAAGGGESATDVIGAGSVAGGRPGLAALGGGGKLAPFGRPGGGAGAAPRSAVFGSTSNLQSVVYVCDASGSMFSGSGEDTRGRSDELERELKNSIASLNAGQTFGVLFFNQGQPQALNNGDLRAATRNFKRAANDFIDTINYTGDTQPLPALELAFRQEPQLVYLLTDGAFTTPADEVLDRLRALNPDRRVRVNTILFLNNDAQVEAVLRQIAEEHGGTFRQVSRDDLNR